jgi:vacuolar-type H+-ATPase subunit H
MKKTLKITAVIILFLIAVIILIPIIFKGKIIEMAKEEANNNLNAKLEFADLKLSLIKNFPDISAEFKDLSIVGIDTFKFDTLVNIKKFKATLDLMSVISGDEIKVKKISLESPSFFVKILQNGTANYDIAKEDTTTDEQTNQTAGDESAFKLYIKKFDIKNGHIIYDDKESDVFAEFENLNFILSGDMTEDITNLKINLTSDSMTVSSEGIKYLNKVKTKFDSELNADLEHSKYSFKENSLALNDIYLTFNGFVEMPDDDITMDLTFKSENATFKNALSLVPLIYKSDFEGIKTDGEFKFDGYAKGVLNDSLMPAYAINLMVKNAFFKYPDLPKSVNNINIDLKLDAKAGSGDDMTINIKKAALTIAENPITMHAFISMSAADIGMKGNITGKIDLNSVKDVIPQENTQLSGFVTTNLDFNGNLSDIENENYEKFDAHGTITISNLNIKTTDMPQVDVFVADFDFSPQFVDVKQLSTKVGKSDFRLNGKINNIFSYVFKDELLSGNFELNSNYITVDELMNIGSTEGDEQNAENEKDNTQNNSESEVIEIPGNLDFVLNSNIQKVTYDKLTVSDVKGIITIKDSKLDMRQLKMSMLGGEMFLSGSYDSKNKAKPLADFTMAISDFSIADVAGAFLSVKQLVPIIENAAGSFSADISLNSVLDQKMMPVIETLISSGNINSNSISIKNNRLFESVSAKTKQDKFKTPNLNNIDLSYIIDKGKLTVKPTIFKIAGSEVNFGGTQSLDKGLDFNLGFSLPKQIAGNLISKFPIGNTNDNVGVTAKIGGTATDPKIVGFSSELTDVLKDEITDKVDEVKEKIKEKTNKILDEARQKADLIVKEAENQASKIKSEADIQGKRLISEAQNQGNKLVNEAKNPIAKKVAEAARDKLVKEARDKAAGINRAADNQTKNIINSANLKAEKLISDAEKKAGN